MRGLRRPGATALSCLVQGPGADSPEHIVRALTFENEGVDAGVVQPLTEQQTGRTGANDGNLGFRVFIVFMTPKQHTARVAERVLWIECLHFSLAGLSIEGEN